MIFVTIAKRLECVVVAHDDCVQAFGDRRLPRIVFPHALRGALLPDGDPFCVYSMNALPRVAREIGLGGFRISSTLKNFGDRNGSNP